MINRSTLRERIFSVNDRSFFKLAKEVSHYQYQNNEVYHRFCNLMRVKPSAILTLSQFPFLPVEIFKTHAVKTGNSPIERTFTSSGTGGDKVSAHQVMELPLYEESFLKCFNHFFGDPQRYCILALLPSYLERADSSLVYMVDHLIKKSKHRASGFFLHDHDKLRGSLSALESKRQPTLLFGVSFALLDFAEKHPMQLKHTVIIETGGMKGRRAEITRHALHDKLKKSLGVKKICSEYGMTELLSQAYSIGEGRFHCLPWMKVLIRDVNDPLTLTGNNSTGGINIIDLANLDSCAFIATADLGKTYRSGEFEVIGRMDFSDLRGCNLMWE